MADFIIRFLICNILLCGIIGIFLLIKHIYCYQYSHHDKFAFPKSCFLQFIILSFLLHL